MASDITTEKPARQARAALTGRRSSTQDAVIEEARRNGLFEGEKTEHVSFRVPPALLAAAKRETGITSTSKLGILALAMLAQQDPVVELMKRTRGRLGKGHTLDC